MTIDERIQALGLVLPEAFRSPTGAAYPFSWVRVRGNRAFISGHLPLQPDGTLAEPRGKVGESLSIEQGAATARLVGLAMLGSLKRELGELEWLTQTIVFQIIFWTRCPAAVRQNYIQSPILFLKVYRSF
jgi:hypothetical protein